MIKPRICVSITESDPIRAVKAIEKIEQHRPDLIEIRLDYMVETEQLKKIREATKIPLIATCRPKDNRFILEEEGRLSLLLEACEAGFNYIDLDIRNDELEKAIDSIRTFGAKLILSYHNYNRTPTRDELQQLLIKESNLGADICKIIGTAESYSDNLTYLEFLSENSEKQIISFGMGKVGKISRVLSPVLGGFFTYSSAETGKEAAPGQLTISELREIYKLMGI